MRIVVDFLQPFLLRIAGIGNRLFDKARHLIQFFIYAGRVFLRHFGHGGVSLCDQVIKRFADFRRFRPQVDLRLDDIDLLR